MLHNNIYIHILSGVVGSGVVGLITEQKNKIIIIINEATGFRTVVQYFQTKLGMVEG